MDSLNKNLLHSSSRIVIKIGSSLLINSKNNFINKKILNNICRDINFLIEKKKGDFSCLLWSISLRKENSKY